MVLALASLANAAGVFLRVAMISFASASLATRMWRALYSEPPESVLMRSYSAVTISSVTGFFLM